MPSRGCTHILTQYGRDISTRPAAAKKNSAAVAAAQRWRGVLNTQCALQYIMHDRGIILDGGVGKRSTDASTVYI